MGRNVQLKPEPRDVVTMEPLLLSAPDAAKALGGISVDLLHKLPVDRVRLGSRVLFTVDSLRGYIEACKHQIQSHE
jgi:hypothetical protein